MHGRHAEPRLHPGRRRLRVPARDQVGATRATLGEVRVTQRVIGYRRVQQFREEVLGVEELDLPEQTFDTVALWWEVPREILGALFGFGHPRELRELVDDTPKVVGLAHDDLGVLLKSLGAVDRAFRRVLYPGQGSTPVDP